MPGISIDFVIVQDKLLTNWRPFRIVSTRYRTVQDNCRICGEIPSNCRTAAPGADRLDANRTTTGSNDVRIAIVGSGIAGLGSAWLLQQQGHAVTVFEAAERLGGHTHTVDVTLDGVTAPVDTGFLVFNDRTYPRLTALFDELGVASAASEMSFSVRVDAEGLEWAGTDLAALFAQPRNAFKPAYWRMLADIVRFNRETTAMLANDAVWSLSLGEYLDHGGYSRAFRDWYLLPMAAAIWSSPRKDILDFPLPAFARFCANHGLLQILDRPQWRTVAGGGRTYVAKIADRLADVRIMTRVERVRRTAHGVELTARGRVEPFDEVVLACHSDQALAVIDFPSPRERALLGRIRYQPNRVVLHTDVRLLPRARRAWSAWNYLAADDPEGQRPVAVSYLINKLQPLPFAAPVIVTLNPPFEPDPATVLQEFEYSHPLLDRHALTAQQNAPQLQGQRHTWYAGAWLGYGFHEDGLASAHAVAAGIARQCATRGPARHDERVAA
jgi:predicted NAD/FAD-binding protein